MSGGRGMGIGPGNVTVVDGPLDFTDCPPEACAELWWDFERSGKRVRP